MCVQNPPSLEIIAFIFGAVVVELISLVVSRHVNKASHRSTLLLFGFPVTKSALLFHLLPRITSDVGSVCFIAWKMATTFYGLFRAEWVARFSHSRSSDKTNFVLK